ncbi:MAG: LCP family protein [Clostridia bacterium]|nr:LCP family protein [Clostridia bacterium]
MDENNGNKYQVIDPYSNKYRLTADDLKKENKARNKKRKALKVLVALLLIFAILVSGAYLYVDSKYLSKINYGYTQSEVDPNLDKEESFEFEKQADADANIKNNLSNDIMWYDDSIFNILLIGYDLGDMAEKYFPRSDSNIIISVNSNTNIINMVSLSRATYAYIPGHGNRRLNTAHAYGGPSLLVDTVQTNYKVRIDKYISVDFKGFKGIIDVLGGIDITMDATEAKAIMEKNSAGTYHLDGDRALAYSRLRWTDNDRTRTGRQRKVLNAIASTLRGASVQTLSNLLDKMLPLVSTNFTKIEILSQLTKAPNYLTTPVHEDIIPHNGAPSVVKDNLEVMLLDWGSETDYLHKLLYPNMTPQSHQQ